ncbi:hypothetical protein C0Q64_13115 [Streptomyces albidoflavus]|nr:hypothetical protein C0Q64_13115 [Streptomyces albidoflavus]RZE03179.1 hypothetical protein C0Q65_13430 [Streptomyces albidoflavus]
MTGRRYGDGTWEADLSRHERARLAAALVVLVVAAETSRALWRSAEFGWPAAIPVAFQGGAHLMRACAPLGRSLRGLRVSPLRGGSSAGPQAEERDLSTVLMTGIVVYGLLVTVFFRDHAVGVAVTAGMLSASLPFLLTALPSRSGAAPLTDTGPPRRRPAFGALLICIGTALRGVAVAYLFGVAFLFAGVAGQRVLGPDASSAVLCAFFFSWCMTLLYRPGVLVTRLGRRLRATVAYGAGGVRGTDLVLFLRPFETDAEAARGVFPIPFATSLISMNLPGVDSGRTTEERLVRAFRPVGRPLALGRPGERLAYAGCDRVYLPVRNWEREVTSLLRRSRMVLLVASSSHPGTLWEFQEAARLLAPQRVVLLLYGDLSSYRSFRAAAHAGADREKRERPEPASAASRRLTLPEVSETGVLTGVGDSVLRGAVTFDARGSGEVRLWDGAMVPAPAAHFAAWVKRLAADQAEALTGLGDGRPR